ncbi:carbonyl reductase [NADPH] 1-like [Asterias rubens]|uniref:carbonyl reductase [NADPH] 1-like n=1 Tax=Asterias rubens TaxID=7604 RepID=UPI0014555D24|nr:carbonyl reductase [NADPH] 1-like [Asterias rubens]
MSPPQRVAVVTGSNKGIGFAAVRALCKQLDNGVVYLTSRNEERGKEAVAKLNKEGLKPQFHQLDIDDRTSVERLRDYLKKTYGGLDILINNAGIAFKASSTEPFGSQATITMATNYTATIDACKILIPVIKPGGRVVSVASFTGKMAFDKMSKENQDRLTATKTEEDVALLMKEFVEAANKGDHVSKGWPDWGYAMTKLGVIGAVKALAQKNQSENPKDDILIMACCPGYVDTDMTSNKGKKTPDEGADTPVYLAMLPPGSAGFNGNMYADRALVNVW